MFPVFKTGIKKQFLIFHTNKEKIMISLKKSNLFIQEIEIIRNNVYYQIYDYCAHDYIFEDMLAVLSTLYINFDNNIKIIIKYAEKTVIYNNPERVFNILINNLKGDEERVINNYLRSYSGNSDNFINYLKNKIKVHNKIGVMQYLLFYAKNRDFMLDFYGFKNIEDVEAQYIELLRNCRGYYNNIKKAA